MVGAGNITITTGVPYTIIISGTAGGAGSQTPLTGNVNATNFSFYNVAFISGGNGVFVSGLTISGQTVVTGGPYLPFGSGVYLQTGALPFASGSALSGFATTIQTNLVTSGNTLTGNDVNLQNQINTINTWRNTNGSGYLTTDAGDSRYLTSAGSAYVYSSGIQTITGFKSFTSGLAIGYGNVPVITGSGRLAYDTNDSTLCIGTSNTTGAVVASPKKSLTFTLENPTSSEQFPISQMSLPITLTKVTATTMPSSKTITFQIQSRAAASLNSAGTNMLSSSLVGSSTGATTTTFSTANLAAGSFLTFVSSAIDSGITMVVVEIDYNILKT
jgi:hypothetical protein